MSGNETAVIALDEFRRRKAERSQAQEKPGPTIVWVPVWVWVPMWPLT